MAWSRSFLLRSIYCFDHQRPGSVAALLHRSIFRVQELRSAPLRTWDHFVSDFEAGRSRNDNDHYRDLAKNVRGLSEVDTEALVNAAPPAVHFHAWDFSSFIMSWQNAIRYFGDAVDIIEISQNHAEVLVAMRRRAPIW